MVAIWAPGLLTTVHIGCKSFDIVKIGDSEVDY